MRLTRGADRRDPVEQSSVRAVPAVVGGAAGAVSRYGAMPLSWTMDKVGVIARTAIDAGLVFDVIRGTDGRDPAARDTSFRWTPAAGENLEGLRFGVLQLERFPSGEGQTNFLKWLAGQAGAAGSGGVSGADAGTDASADAEADAEAGASDAASDVSGD